MRIQRVCGMIVMGVIALGLAACSPPKGEQTRRVEITDTTKAERRSAQVQPAALVEFSDQVAQQLVEDLIALPEFNGPTRVNVVFGDIVNKTGIVPTSDFEAFRTRVRQKLLQSNVARNRVRWIESRQKVEDLRRKELGGAGSDVNQGGANGPSPLAAEATYFLDGEMYRVVRGEDAVNLYMMSFNLSNAQSREIVWTNSPYEIKQTPGR